MKFTLFVHDGDGPGEGVHQVRSTESIRPALGNTFSELKHLRILIGNVAHGQVNSDVGDSNRGGRGSVIRNMSVFRGNPAFVMSFGMSRVGLLRGLG
ncbi:MAG: hypothetical protein HRU17_07935 [Polyangiaceae bacterium]|nr:hypothetical protein [Polyangiaceae bacterium]